MGDPERYCARLVKFERLRCVFEFPAISAEFAVMGIGGTGTLMQDMGEILGGKMALLFMVTVVGGGGGGGSGGGIGDAVWGSRTRLGAFC